MIKCNGKQQQQRKLPCSSKRTVMRVMIAPVVFLVSSTYSLEECTRPKYRTRLFRGAFRLKACKQSMHASSSTLSVFLFVESR